VRALLWRQAELLLQALNLFQALVKFGHLAIEDVFCGEVRSLTRASAEPVTLQVVLYHWYYHIEVHHRSDAVTVINYHIELFFQYVGRSPSTAGTMTCTSVMLYCNSFLRSRLCLACRFVQSYCW
jgi:hypothetical protein